jgi:AcrR family transcriptional regulator
MGQRRAALAGTPVFGQKSRVDRARTRRNRSGEATRAKIIEAAIAVLSEQGFSGFTLQAVADRAEVLFGSVTHHYGTRDGLVEAMLAAVLERYRERFNDLAAAVQGQDEGPVRVLVTWLVDDAVDPGTANVFLELWAMATHAPQVATAVNGLYDHAIDACIDALGLLPRTRQVVPLRQALYVLGTVIEGSSALFGSRDRRRGPWKAIRSDAIDLLVPFIEGRLAECIAAGAPKNRR